MGTKPEFQILQTPADGGHSDAEPLRSLREAARLDDHNEGTDFLNLAHNVAPYIIIGLQGAMGDPWLFSLPVDGTRKIGEKLPT